MGIVQTHGAVIGAPHAVFTKSRRGDRDVLHRRMADSPDPAGDFQRMEWLHRVLLVLSLGTVVAAVAGSHGLL